MKLKKVIALGMSVILTAVSLTACGGGTSTGSEGTAANTSSTPLIVSSKDFTESLVLGEVYALAFEDAGIKVDRKLNLGSSLVHDAIVNKQIDFYVDYTGTGYLTDLGKEAISDAQKVYDTVKEEFEKQWQITWLTPSNVNDSEGMFMLKSKADALNIHTYSDLWAHASELKLGAFGEFYENLYPKMKKVYGDVKFQKELTIDYALNFEACRKGEIDVFNQYSTNGQLSSGEFEQLKDDKNVWPPYYICPLIRDDALKNWPKAEEVANAISALLTTDDMIKMNKAVDVDGEDYEDVAADYYDSIKDKLPL